jgi:RNA polymerase sigma-70 factor (ECF subfamily)
MNAAQTSLDFGTAPASFEDLALPLTANLYGQAMRLTRNAAEAEDLVQDAMVRALRFWDTFTQGTNVKAWLFTILRNTFINGYHKQGRAKSFTREVEAEVHQLGPVAAIGHTTSEPAAADEVIDAADTKARISAALAELPPDYRTAVTLADLEGLSYKEVAEAMDCPIGTVMSRVYRGRKMLYALLYDHAQDLGMVEGERAAARPSTRGGR